MQISEYLPAINSVKTALDIAFVFVIVYVVLRLLRGTRAVPTAVGIVLLALLYWLAVAQDFITLEFVLASAIFYLPILIIVLFQSEIRQAFIFFGNRLRFPLLHKQYGNLGETIYDEIILAATTLASSKTGALIIFERNVGLRNFIDSGVQIDSNVSYDLLVTIFNPLTPLHDGAVIIRQERIAAASCFLPLTKNPNISRELGTRHRAAIGVTEGTDAISVVVSEETGLISFVEDGKIRRNLDTKTLQEFLLRSMDISLTGTSPKSNRQIKEAKARMISESETEATIG